MRVAVTGATGFIGRHLVRHLLAERPLVRAVARDDARARLLLPPQVELAGYAELDRALVGVDTVVHLAGRAHVLVESAHDPEREFEAVNVTASATLAQHCVDAGIERFVLMSSVGAMTSASETLLDEATPCRPDTPYGRSKLRAEQVVRRLLPSATVIRAPLVYGPDNPGNMERLVKLVRSELPLPLGAINNRRSLVYVGNLSSAIEHCVRDQRSRGQTFLVADAGAVSTTELISQIAEADDRRVRLLPVPVALLRAFGRASDVAGRAIGRRLPLSLDMVNKLVDSLPIDTHRIRDTLAWTPPFTMQEGLRATLRGARSPSDPR
jgi:nucleoside-diphosphate-sugar epimerase